MAAAKKEVNWTEYFQSIQSVCPWSLPAWTNGKIEVVQWKGTITPLNNYLARVYIVDLNPRRLKKLANKLEDTSIEDEWLWSHPRYKNYSTPVPVLIQQNRQMLENIRNKEKHNASS